MEKYNGFYDAQEDADFGKEAYRLSELRTAPFYGIWYGGSLLTTVDGLRINEDMQVLNAESQPIEGLYAAGDCSGSIFGTTTPSTSWAAPADAPSRSHATPSATWSAICPSTSCGSNFPPFRAPSISEAPAHALGPRSR